MKIVSRTESITPDTAKKYLEKNTQNRPIREAVVDRYAAMMSRNQWIITHQGIAFDEDGCLLDGQHRLHAIIKCGQPVDIMVTRGITTGRDNGVLIPTMDVIDCGKARTVGDQLHLSHGIPNANRVAAACVTIVAIAHGCGGGNNYSLTTPQAVEILAIYGKAIARAMEIMGSFKPSRKGAVIGAFAFASITHREQMENLMSSINSGEELKRGNPALTARDWMIRGSWNSVNGSGRTPYIASCMLSAAHSVVAGSTLTLIKTSDQAVKFFCAKQKGNVEKIRSLVAGK